jgi:hypothetical protein
VSLSADGPAFLTSDTFLADRGAYYVSRWHRYNEFNAMHLDLLSCFVGEKGAVLKRIPAPPKKTW